MTEAGFCRARSVYARSNRGEESLRVVYRVTGKNTGTELFSRMKAGDTIPVLGPLGNGISI